MMQYNQPVLLAYVLRELGLAQRTAEPTIQASLAIAQGAAGVDLGYTFAFHAGRVRSLDLAVDLADLRECHPAIAGLRVPQDFRRRLLRARSALIRPPHAQASQTSWLTLLAAIYVAAQELGGERACSWAQERFDVDDCLMVAASQRLMELDMLDAPYRPVAIVCASSQAEIDDALTIARQVEQLQETARRAGIDLAISLRPMSASLAAVVPETPAAQTSELDVAV